MKEELISIVIPVYNAYKYIEDCLQHILAQTYKKYEVILVDDGSKDNSLMLCKTFSEQFSNIHVYTKKNGGPSEARNFGVMKSQGEYITFIDIDDLIHFDYLSKLYELMAKYEADISVVGLRVFNERDGITNKVRGKEKLFPGIEAVKNMLYQRDIDTSPCAMLIAKKIVTSFPFPLGRFHEDDFTTYKFYLEAKKVALYTGTMYYYIQHEGSIMHTIGKVNYDEIAAADHLVEVFSEYNYNLKKAALSKKFSNYCQVILKNTQLKYNDPKTYNEIVDFLKSTKWKIIFDRNTRMKNKIAAFILIFGPKALMLINKMI